MNLLATGTAGTGTVLTASGKGSVNEIDQMMQTMWDTSQSSVSVLYVNSQELRNITTKVLQAIVFRGGDKVWVAGKGGSILKRLAPLAPVRIDTPRLPPVLRNAAPRSKLKPRIPTITITDDGDIPLATPPRKQN